MGWGSSAWGNDWEGDSGISVDAISLTITISADIGITPDISGWIWTTRIGSMNFDMDVGGSGEAVRFPLAHSGWVYEVKKLGASSIAYGENGVSILKPYGVNWGNKVIHKIGIIGQDAVAGNDDKHYFIDKIGNMYELTFGELPKKLDYSNTLGSLDSNTVMSYDWRRDMIFITDGTLGYVLTSSGLGQCPPTISGTGYKDGAFYVTSPSTITNSPLEITTDTVDFGTRYNKFIRGLEVGVALSNDIYAAIDYRQNKSNNFSSTDWRKVDNEGLVGFTVSAVDFRFKLKLITYEDIQLDYFNVLGSFIGDRLIEGALI